MLCWLRNTVLALSLTGMFASAAIPAQSSPDCEQAIATAELVACAEQEYQHIDRQLNRAYQALIGTLDGEGKRLLRQAQRAWIEFRDAECAWQADEARGGSLAGVLHPACLADLTHQRATELQRFRKRGVNQ